ncbi:hypothetical protein DAI21_17475 [Lelliottia sp. WB101]|nr:hypothetical protein DAI21_17475 [Lelliottia sp. WB101]
MLKALAILYVIGFIVVRIFLALSTDMPAKESMDIAAAWPHQLYKYIELYFDLKSHQENPPFGK